jgi:hypothetical protein
MNRTVPADRLRAENHPSGVTCGSSATTRAAIKRELTASYPNTKPGGRVSWRAQAQELGMTSGMGSQTDSRDHP